MKEERKEHEKDDGRLSEKSSGEMGKKYSRERGSIRLWILLLQSFDVNRAERRRSRMDGSKNGMGSDVDSRRERRERERDQEKNLPLSPESILIIGINSFHCSAVEIISLRRDPVSA